MVDEQGYRLALSWINEALRLGLDDPDSPLTHPATPVHDGSVAALDMVNYLHLHETGHLFGLQHPHQIETADGSRSNRTFEDVWSSMSYGTHQRVVDVSAVDQANFQRSQAAYLAVEASDRGLEGEPSFASAIEAIDGNRWGQAASLLRGLLDDARNP